MTQPLLSILIPTVVGREDLYRRLFDLIYTQCRELTYYDESKSYGFLPNTPVDVIVSHCWGGVVEVITEKDNKEVTIGEKREKLYQLAHGIFSIQIDDDDELAPNAIQLILEAIKSNPDVDCITFEEHININGEVEKSNHSLSYGDWEGEGGKELWDGFHYHRTPFFKSVIKTEIAKSVPIPHIRFGEDHQWAQALKSHLKTEVHISQELYRYIHISSPHNERYGITN